MVNTNCKTSELEEIGALAHLIRQMISVAEGSIIMIISHTIIVSSTFRGLVQLRQQLNLLFANATTNHHVVNER